MTQATQLRPVRNPNVQRVLQRRFNHVAIGTDDQQDDGHTLCNAARDTDLPRVQCVKRTNFLNWRRARVEGPD